MIISFISVAIPPNANVNAVVIQVPLDELFEEQDDNTLLLWVQSAPGSTFSTQLKDSSGKPFTGKLLKDVFGRSDDDIDAFNQLEPKDQGNDPDSLLPDVLVFRKDQPDGYPNGRTLYDDVTVEVLNEALREADQDEMYSPSYNVKNCGDITGDGDVDINEDEDLTTGCKYPNVLPLLTDFPFLAKPNQHLARPN